MNIFPAIDLFGGKAVRLYRGRYDEMTVYSDNPAEIAKDFYAKGARFMHVVDLEGAKSGETPNIETVKRLVNAADMFVEVGGGIRSIEVAKKYIDAGVSRIILGTAALTDRAFLTEALGNFGDMVAVGVDIKDGMVAIKGWTEKTEKSGEEFCGELEALGVRTVICTDISKDGAMLGTNRELYGRLSEKCRMNIIASGGVSTIDDVRALRKMNIYGAIIGKAYYTGAINLTEAIEVAK
ncbi:MAG: 1-(5-phosphoribosyl)-5-[(5-phosphoribosylamino)methylideneamino]imidazole-4-carboxamide isomerase [Ruminococcaceae bacterium]|nr:1-(5-phosphoribosyl)-5-[(5-phosphoribosylamino)methylideneamino]imidazole-4-carboxamide isomerase [Oscillospiraceae bacterium]